jgi:hypothetical protein
MSQRIGPALFSGVLAVHSKTMKAAVRDDFLRRLDSVGAHGVDELRFDFQERSHGQLPILVASLISLILIKQSKIKCLRSQCDLGARLHIASTRCASISCCVTFLGIAKASSKSHLFNLAIAGSLVPAAVCQFRKRFAGEIVRKVQRRARVAEVRELQRAC